MKRSFPLFLILILLFAALSSCGNKNNNQTVQKQSEIEWITNIDSALTLASSQNKPLMIDFMASWCPPCRTMEDSTFSDERVIDKAKFFITVRIDVDKHQDVAIKYDSNANKYGGIGIPNILFLGKDGNKLKHPIGFLPPEDLLAVMDSVLTIYKTE